MLRDVYKRQVQLLRGEITVESKEGESAGFIVTLPYLEVEEMDLDEQADEEVPVAQPVAAEATAETTGNIGCLLYTSRS